MAAMGKVKCTQLLIVCFLLCSILALNDASTDKNQQTFVVRYKNGEQTIPVTVVLDFKKQTEYVINMSPRASTKTVTLYDFKQRTIAYKDLTNRECFLGKLTHETLNEETDALNKIQNPVEHKPKVLSLDPKRGSLTPTEIRNMAGQKTAVFCRKMNTWLVLSPSTHNVLKREVDEEEETTYHRHGFHTVRYSHYGRETRRKYKNPRHSTSRPPLSQQNENASKKAEFKSENQHFQSILEIDPHQDKSVSHRSFPDGENGGTALSYPDFSGTLDQTGPAHSANLEESSRFLPSLHSNSELGRNREYPPNLNNQLLPSDHSNHGSYSHRNINIQQREEINTRTPENDFIVSYRNSVNQNPISFQAPIVSQQSENLDGTNNFFNSPLYNSEIVDSREYTPQRADQDIPQIKDTRKYNDIESESLPSGYELSLLRQHALKNSTTEPIISEDSDVSLNVLGIPKSTKEFENFAQPNEDVHDLFEGFHNLRRDHFRPQHAHIAPNEPNRNSIDTLTNTYSTNRNGNYLTNYRDGITAISSENLVRTSATDFPVTTIVYDDYERGPSTLSYLDSISNSIKPYEYSDKHAFPTDIPPTFAYNPEVYRNNGNLNLGSNFDRSSLEVPNQNHRSDIPSEIEQNQNVKPEINFSRSTFDRNSPKTPPLSPTSFLPEGLAPHYVRFQNVLRQYKPDQIVIDIEKFPTQPPLESTEAFEDHSIFVTHLPTRKTNSRLSSNNRRRNEQRSGETWRTDPIENSRQLDRNSNTRQFHHIRNGGPTTNTELLPTEIRNFPDHHKSKPHRGTHQRKHSSPQSNYLRPHHQFDALPPGVSIHPRHPKAPYADMFLSNMPPPVPQESNRGIFKHHRQRHHRKKSKLSSSCCNSHRNGSPAPCCRNGGSCCQNQQLRLHQASITSKGTPCCTSSHHGRRGQVLHARKDPHVLLNEAPLSNVLRTVHDNTDRCEKLKMCRTLYESTNKVMVCRNADIEGC